MSKEGEKFKNHLLDHLVVANFLQSQYQVFNIFVCLNGPKMLIFLSVHLW